MRLIVGDVDVEIGSRWRHYKGDALVTVHVRVLTDSTGDDRNDIPGMLFQVKLAVVPAPHAQILEYDTTRTFDVDPDTAELRLRYRNRKVYAVGHGMAADWEFTEGRCTKAYLDPVPAFVVPTIETTGFNKGSAEARSLTLQHLQQIDTHPDAYSTPWTPSSMPLAPGSLTSWNRPKPSAPTAPWRSASPNVPGRRLIG
ncbi:hypothetical protein [Streptomyces sp. MAR4 CNX-425]|uniref:hypothetical protein n=1 Tax=Streptomyces sp. MAR4 CNX-425 TaxID=3406343 RepID=UPI003B506A39